MKLSYPNIGGSNHTYGHNFFLEGVKNGDIICRRHLGFAATHHALSITVNYRGSFLQCIKTSVRFRTQTFQTHSTFVFFTGKYSKPQKIPSTGKSHVSVFSGFWDMISGLSLYVHRSGCTANKHCLGLLRHCFSHLIRSTFWPADITWCFYIHSTMLRWNYSYKNDLTGHTGTWLWLKNLLNILYKNFNVINVSTIFMINDDISQRNVYISLAFWYEY